MDNNKFFNEFCLDADLSNFTSRQLTRAYTEITSLAPPANIMRNKEKLAQLLCTILIENPLDNDQGEEDSDLSSYGEKDGDLSSSPVIAPQQSAVIPANFSTIKLPASSSLSSSSSSSFSSSSSSSPPLENNKIFKTHINDLGIDPNESLGSWFHFRGNATYQAPWLSYLLQHHAPDTFCVPSYEDSEDILKNYIALNVYTKDRPYINDDVLQVKANHVFERDTEIEFIKIEVLPSAPQVHFFEAEILGHKQYYTSRTNIHQRPTVTTNNPRDDFYIRKMIPRNVSLIADPVFFETIKKCDKDPKIIYSIHFLTIHQARDENGHANIVLFNHKSRELARVEPNGRDMNGSSHLAFDATIDKLFQAFVEQHSTIFKYYSPPQNICSHLGPQEKERMQSLYAKEVRQVRGTEKIIETSGFCGLFSLLFVHYRLENPELSNKQVMDKLNKSSNDLAFHIRLYAKHIVEFVTKKSY